MNVFRAFLYISATLVVAAGCGKKNVSLDTKSIEQIHSENGIPVRTETVAERPFETEFSYFSVVTGIEETSAYAKISDKVEHIHFKVGDPVSQHDIVITFPTDNPAAQYMQAKAAHDHAETTLQRIKTLYENGGISLQEYENTRTQYEVAKANWESVQQTVAVEAPISGTVTNIAVHEADNVSPGDILFTISNTYKLKTRVWVSEDQIEDIAVGNTATASWRDITLEGTIVQVDLSLDSSKQGYGVVIEFDNSQYLMMSGVNAEIFIHGKRNDQTIMIERKNIQNDGESDYVFLAENNVAVKRNVILGRSTGLDVEIVRGLEPGDQLIVEGQLLLEDAMKILLTN